ncbi:MAG: hypothetical protein RR141_06765, partial [Rikenellaceae bacterium]
NKNITLIQDTLRLSSRLASLKGSLGTIIESGSTETLIAKRKMNEYQQTVRRRDQEIQTLKPRLAERSKELDQIEFNLSSQLSTLFKGDAAVIYQTQNSVNIEFSDCKIYKDSMLIDSVKLLIKNIAPFLNANSHIGIVVDSYAAENSGKAKAGEVWNLSAKKGFTVANELIINGIDVSRVQVITHGNSYSGTVAFLDDCPLHTIVKLVLDSTEIIDLLNSISTQK